MFLDGKTSKYYLLNQDSWLSAIDPLKGAWLPEKSAPSEISKLPDNEHWKSVRAAVPGKTITKAPKVFASATPAELILTEGPPRFTPISGTRLMLVGNTESRLIFFPAEKAYYFSVAGRWFRAGDLNGPWSAATTSLPEEFAGIPADDELLSDIRATIPGTDEAKDAILLAQTPQTAEIKRDATVQIIYDNDPIFRPIEGTEVQYAVNTRYQVFKVGSNYYCCFQGVWFESPTATGPWVVSGEIPNPIYTIPVTHPAHNVSYVRVYDAGRDTVVVGYTSGYRGAYVSHGALRYGAGVVVVDEDSDGYHYYVYSTPSYSYGSGVVYDWRRGGYYRAATAYGPYGGAGRGGHYNPYTGGWSRGAYAYGPLGGSYAAHGYNPYTDTYRAHAGGSNIYGNWGRTYIQNDDEWLRAGHRATDDSRVGWTFTSNDSGAVRVKTDDRQGAVARDDEGNIYVGNDDHIYRRDEDGDWSRREDGEWEDVEGREKAKPSTLPANAAAPRPRPANLQKENPSAGEARTQPTTDFRRQLESQAAARNRGERNVSRARASSASRTTPATRPSRGRR